MKITVVVTSTRVRISGSVVGGPARDTRENLGAVKAKASASVKMTVSLDLRRDQGSIGSVGASVAALWRGALEVLEGCQVVGLAQLLSVGVSGSTKPWRLRMHTSLLGIGFTFYLR
ncbi:MAG: hypothetical protein R2715_07335 [Ilumatobacteraceae bacterium]